jgi:hypothetical protein
MSETKELTVLIKSAELPGLIALKTQAAEIAKNCSSITITDDNSLAIGRQILTKANKLVKDTKEVLISITKPYKDECKKLEAIVAEFLNPVVLAVEEGRKKVIAYDKLQEDKKNIELVRIEKIKADIQGHYNMIKRLVDDVPKMNVSVAIKDAELIKINENYIKAFPDAAQIKIVTDTLKAHPEQGLNMKEFASPRWGEFLMDAHALRMSLFGYIKGIRASLVEPESEIAVEKAQEAIQEAEVISSNIGTQATATVKSESVSTGIRKTWTFKVADPTKVPEKFKMINTAAVKEYLKECKEAGMLKEGAETTILGITFYQEKGATL